MKIYIADLAAYNNGFLVGEWIDFEEVTTSEELQDKIDAILAHGTEICEDQNYPHEEYAIHDYEDSEAVGGSVSEYSSPFDLLEKFNEFISLEEHDQIKLAAAKEAFGANYVKIENLDEIDMYECDIEELAEQFVEEGLFGEISPSIINYIDYKAIARDLACDYTEIDHNGSTYCLRW